MKSPHSLPVTRPERNELVLRFAVKLGICGHLVFTVIWPILTGDSTAKIWPISQLFGGTLLCAIAVIVAAMVLVAQWCRPLRVAGGVLYMAFCLTHAALVSEWRSALFSICMSFCGLALAWTGVPDRD